MVPRFTTGVTAKVLGVAGLALSMLIPLAQVNDLIGERAGRAQEAARQIAVRWGAPQVVGGPVLAVPVRCEVYPSTQDSSLSVFPAQEAFSRTGQDVSIRSGSEENAASDPVARTRRLSILFA